MTYTTAAASAEATAAMGCGPVYNRQDAVQRLIWVLGREYRRWFQIVAQISVLDGNRIDRDNWRAISERLTRKADDTMRHITGIKEAAHVIGITDAMLETAMGPLAEELQRGMEAGIG